MDIENTRSDDRTGKINNSMTIKKYKSGSITVEASLCFPIAFFALIALCYLFTYMRVEYTVQREIYIAARNISPYGNLIKPVNNVINDKAGKANDKISDVLLFNDGIYEVISNIPALKDFNLKSVLVGKADAMIVGFIVDSYLPESVYKYMSGGTSGIDYSGSVLMDEDDCIQINCSYRLKLPFGLFPNAGVNAKHNLKYRYFTGTEFESLLDVVDEMVLSGSPQPTPIATPETTVTPTISTPTVTPTPVPTVLITETGYVYHYVYECPSLKIKLSLVNFSDIDKKRNEGGGKYYPCEHCLKKGVEMTECYITPDGDRYHIRSDCPGLKRTIFEVPIDEVGKRRECKRCRDKKK